MAAKCFGKLLAGHTGTFSGYGLARIHCNASPTGTGGPNHIHGIIEIKNGNEIIAGAKYISPPNNQPSAGKWTNNDSPQRVPFHSPSQTIGSVIRGFKTGVTKWFRYGRADNFFSQLEIGQRNYYDPIIRNSTEYNRISHYIITNPFNWKEDRLY